MRGIGRSIGLALGCAAALIAMAAPAASAACPNEAIREAQGDTGLPSCMALELLSPPKKSGQEATELAGFSPDSTRALYKSKAALADTEGLKSFIGDGYVGLLTPGFWATKATSPPADADIKVGGANYGGPYAFSEDFGKWALLGATKSQQFASEGQFFTDGLEGPFAMLSPLLAPINNSGNTIQTEMAELAPAAATTPEITASVFPTFFSGTSYLPDDPREVTPDRNNYLVFRDSGGQPTLRLLGRDGAGTVYGGRCGTRLGNGALNQGAVSPDGSRMYFMTRPDQAPSVGTDGPPCNTANPLRVMVREDALAADATIEELFSGGSGTGDDLFQGASVDSSKVFLMSPRKLASSDQDASAEACSADVGSSKGCDLYLYDSALPEPERLIQVSVGGAGDPDPGKGADVLTATVAIAPDGSHAYFVAQGVLTTTPNPQGATATAGKANLYLYERDSANPTGQTSFIGTLAEDDKSKLWGLARSFANGAYAVPLAGGPQGGDGHILFLTSKAPLTPEADDGGLADIFRYDADADTLVCATCDPSLTVDVAAGPNEALEVPPSSNFTVQGRWASEDGETMVFSTAPSLLGTGDPYLWREGELTELPGEVRAANALQRPVLSMDGDVAGFTTTEALLPQDGDTARDVYLVRVNGGFLPTPSPPVCNPLVEGSCRGEPSAPPPLSAPNSETTPSAGNVKPKPACKKGFVRKKGKCVKKPKGKANKQGKAKAGKRANTKQGGSK